MLRPQSKSNPLPSPSQWGVNDKILLTNIQRSKSPDIQSFCKLCGRLQEGGDAYMHEFLVAGGVNVLVQAIQNRISRQPLYEVDIVVLYEILLCCAVVVEAPAGIDEFLDISIGIESVARCLNFDSKIFSLKVLDILTAFCSHSVDAAQAVFKGLKMSAKSRKEAPFADLTSALIDLDVETKKSVLSFVNTLLTALSNSHIYIELKSDLKSQLFDERIAEALQLVDQGIEELNIIDRGATNEATNVSNCSPPPRISTLLNSSNISGYESVDFGDIYGTPAISNNLSDTSKYGSNSTSESLSIDELYVKAAGDDSLTFTDVYDKEIEFENTSHGDNCDSTVVDDSKMSDLYENSYAGSFDNHVPNVEFFSSANVMSNLKAPKIPMAKKSSRDKSPRHLERTKSFADDLLCVTYNSVGTGDAINVVSKSKEITVTPRSGTMAGVLVVTKSSKHLYMITSKPTIRWFELDNEKLKHTKTTDSTVEEGSMSIASMTDIRSYTTSSAIIQEHLHHTFEIETATHVYSFGCNESAIKDAWLVALSANRERFIVDNSSYKARVVEIGALTVEKVLLFAEEFKEQCEIYSNIVMEDHRYDVDDLNINMEDIAEVFTYLQGELLVAGLSSKLLLIMHELIHVPTYTDVIWDIIYTTVKNIRMNSNKDSDAVDSTNSASVSAAMVKEFQESGYAEVGSLAMITSSLERENKELKGRIRQLEEEYISDIANKKKFLSREEADETKKILKMAERLKGFEEQALSDLKTMQRLNDRVQSLEEELEFYKRREAFLSASASVSISASASSISGSPSVFNIPSSNSSHAFAEPNPLRRRSFINKAVTPENLFPPANNNDMVLVSVANSVNMELNASPTQTLSPIIVPSNSVSAAADVVAVTLPPPVNEKLEKYRKMIKLLPAAAVKQKMSLDGISTSEIDSFLADLSKAVEETESPAGGSTAPSVPAPPKVDERLEKYRKMIKILPEHALRQKMALDGFTADQIEAFVQNKGDSPPPAAASSATEDVLTSSKYEKYRKMLKLVPEHAVRQKMVVDGLSASEIEQFFLATSKADSKPASIVAGNGAKEDSVDDFTTPPEDMAVKVLTTKPTVKLKGLFWSKLKSVEVKNTVFHKLEDYPIPSSYLKEIDKLFAANTAKTLSRRIEGSDIPKADNKDTEAEGVDGKEKSTKLVSVVDSNRIQNILIVMGKLRLCPEDVMRLIIELDPDVMTTDITSSIKSILPLPEEANAVRLHTDPSKLDHASKLYFHLCRIPRLVTRIECHEIAFSWHSFSNEIFSQLHIVQSALDELGKFQRNMEVILSMILAIGNYLNADTKWGLAYGFKLETINKLETMRASQSTEGSMIHILSKVVCDQAPDVLAISKKWIAIPAAASISFRQIVADVELLVSQIKKVTHEYQRIQDGEVNMGLDGQLEDRQGCVTNPLSRRLEGFLSEATPRMSIISSQMENIERNISTMMGRYGERFTLSSDEDLCKKFFQSISLFFRSLRSAADDNLKRRKAAERQHQLELERKNRASRSRQKSDELQAKAPTATETVKSATPLKTKHTKTRRRSKAATGPSTSEIDSFLSDASKAAEHSTTVPSAAGGSAAPAPPLVEEGRQRMALDGFPIDHTVSFVQSKGDSPAPQSSSDSVQSAPSLPPLKVRHPKPPRRIPAEQPTVS